MAALIQTREGSWRAQVRRDGKYASRTFRLKGHAQDWVGETEYRIDNGGEVTTPLANKASTITHLIDLHISDLQEVGQPLRRSKRAVLEALKRDLGTTKIRNLDRSTIITYGKKHAKDGAGPVTLAVDFLHRHGLNPCTRGVCR